MLLLLCFPSAALAAAAQQPETGKNSSLLKEALQYEGLVVASIEFDPVEQPLPDDELRRRLPFAPGDVFHEHVLREAIQRLYATGRYAGLAVDARRAEKGVALRFLTQRAYFVGSVHVTGVKQPPNNGQLTSAAKLVLGTPFADSDKLQAVESLTSILRQNGFYNAKVSTKVELRTSTEQANLTFAIQAGKRARFEKPIVYGNPERSVDAIIRATRWKRLYGLFGLGWNQVTDSRVRQGVDNVRRYYQNRNLLETKVTLSRLDYQRESNTVRPAITIAAGPKVTVRVQGAKISRGKLVQLAPIYQERSVDPDLLMEGERNIEQYLQSEGYFEAAVTHSVGEGTSEHEQVVTYNVTRGGRHKFVALSIAGNHYFSKSTIRERLYIEPASLPRFPYGRYNETYLRQDVQAVRSLYAASGFRDVKVTPRIVDDFQGGENRTAVFIDIVEGSQWFVSDLFVDGVAASDRTSLESMLASSKNQPYSEANVANDRANLLNYYYSRGYLNATFDYHIEPSDQLNHVALRYVLAAGPRKYVRDVLVTGLETTRSKLVFDRVELSSGQPLSLTAQTDTQRRLYDLGIFARVNTAIQNSDGDEDRKYVQYDIDEASHYSLNVGVGAQIARIGGGVTSLDNPAGTAGFAPRLAVGITRLNFLGLGQTLGLQTAVSTIEQRAALTYFIPHVVSHDNLSFTATALLENSNDIRTFTAYRREASVQLGQRLSRAYSLQYRMVFRNVTISNLKIQQLLVPLLSQPETVGLGEVSLIQDKRDDPTDAHSGIYTTLDLSYAPSSLGSQTQFARGLFRNSTYHAFGRELVFARSTQFGLISRTGGRPSIPLAERIYSGGSTSLRAFPDFQAGPRDASTGFPLGGNTVFTNTLELRFPLYGDNLGGVLFHDAGNVFSSLGNFSLRFRQQNLQDFNYTVQSVGFGIRYRTPIGPVRLDLSFSPNAPRFFGLKGTEQDYLNGTAPATVQKINAFQFHFSLGQAF